MTEQQPAEIVVAGSLEAKIIRACPTHRLCPLTCTQRTIEELGTIASFDLRPMEAEQHSWRQKLAGWMARFSSSQSGGTSQ